jgi:ABC-type nitrate/sulfonate/bicarbonate transport system substrate-binding protein
MKKSVAFTVMGIAVLLVLLSAGCVQQPASRPNTTGTEVDILYAGGVGPMPVLISTNQIDGYIAWQPFVSIATDAKIGQLVTYSQNLPPENKWANHPCCVLTARDDLIASNPDFVNAMAAQTILADKWITDNPDKASVDLAEFLAGSGNFTYGNVSVSSTQVLKDAIPTVKYTTDPTPQWINQTKEFTSTQIQLGYINAKLKNTSASDMNGVLFDFGPYAKAQEMIKNKKIVTPAKLSQPVGIGYLKGDMHGGAIMIAVKEWQYFNDTYGIALKPRDLTAARPDVADLIVNGVPVAEIHLTPADAGPQLMQLEATGSIVMGYAGVPPALASIDKGSPVKILMPINTEGSGLVSAINSPAKDWNSFMNWAAMRSASGKPLKIAAPAKGSIQDVMLKSALESSGVTVKEVS